MTLTYRRCGTYDTPLEGRWTPPCVGVSLLLFSWVPYSLKDIFSWNSWNAYRCGIVSKPNIHPVL